MKETKFAVTRFENRNGITSYLLQGLRRAYLIPGFTSVRTGVSLQ